MKLEKSDLLRRFERLSPRERLWSISCIIFIIFYGLYMLVYAPITEETVLIEQKISAHQLIYQHIKKISTEVASLRQNAQIMPNAGGEQSLMAVLDASSQQMEIKPGIKRMIPEGTDKVTLWLENISFDKLSQWLAVLETKHAITVTQVNINREANKLGSVNAKLLLSN